MNATKPAVSVIIPNYNYARYLRKRLSTVLDQTYRDLEVIYLDDGSTDDSAEVLTEFDDPRLRCFLNDSNSGSPFIQINKGVRLARGDLVWVAEADDYAHPRLLESLVDVLNRNPSVGVAYCQSIEVDEHGNEMSLVDYRSTGQPERWRHDYIADGSEEYRRYLCFRNTIPNFSAVVFRKNIFEAAGFADESLRLCGDWLTWIKMLAISDVAFLANPMNFYRQHACAVRKNLCLALQAREAYYIHDYCRAKLALSDREANKVLGNLMRMWMRNAMWKGKVRFHDEFPMLFNLARGSDPYFWPHLVKYAPREFLSGLSRQARRRFRALRPGG